MHVTVISWCNDSAERESAEAAARAGDESAVRAGAEAAARAGAEAAARAGAELAARAGAESAARAGAESAARAGADFVDYLKLNFSMLYHLFILLRACTQWDKVIGCVCQYYVCDEKNTKMLQ